MDGVIIRSMPEEDLIRNDSMWGHAAGGVERSWLVHSPAAVPVAITPWQLVLSPAGVGEAKWRQREVQTGDSRPCTRDCGYYDGWPRLSICSPDAAAMAMIWRQLQES